MKTVKKYLYVIGLLCTIPALSLAVGGFHDVVGTGSRDINQPRSFEGFDEAGQKYYVELRRTSEGKYVYSGYAEHMGNKRNLGIDEAKEVYRDLERLAA